MREHGVQTVQLKLQGAPDLHPEEGTRVVHDVHRSAVEQSPAKCLDPEYEGSGGV